MSTASVGGEVDRRGVVDDDVDPAEAVHGGADGAGDVVVVADIADQRQRPAAGGLDLFGGGVDGALQLGVGLAGLGQQHHVGAVPGRAQRDGQADAAAAAGDEDGAVPEGTGGLVGPGGWRPKRRCLKS